MKILVTGIAGFVGSHLAKELVKEHEVIGIDDLSTGTLKNIEGLKLTFRQCSLSDSHSILALSRNVDAIIHLAAKTSVIESNNNEFIYNTSNIKGTLDILYAAKLHKIKKFIFASSAAIYSPKSIYAVSKLTGEHFCNVFSELYGIQTINLRFFNIYGQGQNPTYAGVISKFISNVKNNEPLRIFGDGYQTRDFVHVDDIVQSIILALRYNGSGTYDIGYGESVSVNKLAEKLLELTEKSNPIKHEEAIKGEVYNSYSNIVNSIDDLGYKPRIGIIDGLKSLL